MAKSSPVNLFNRTDKQNVVAIYFFYCWIARSFARLFHSNGTIFKQTNEWFCLFKDHWMNECLASKCLKKIIQVYSFIVLLFMMRSGYPALTYGLENGFFPFHIFFFVHIYRISTGKTQTENTKWCCQLMALFRWITHCRGIMQINYCYRAKHFARLLCRSSVYASISNICFSFIFRSHRQRVCLITIQKDIQTETTFFLMTHFAVTIALDFMTAQWMSGRKDFCRNISGWPTESDA